MTSAQLPPVTPPPPPVGGIRDLALRLFGTDRAADHWMDRPNPEFGGQTPTQLIQTGRGQVVNDFLDACLAGEYG